MDRYKARRIAIETMLRSAWATLYTGTIGRTSAVELERAGRALTLVASAGLTEQQAEVVWARAEGTPWKVMAHRSGVSEDTLQRRYAGALAEISAAMMAAELVRRGRTVRRSRAA